jgi:hypothetical protein
VTLHMQGRQNVVGRDIIELESCLDAIVRHFTLHWLEATAGDHPLQKLWNRTDALATNQLIIFGDSLLVMEHINEQFVRKNVEIIRSNTSVNNRKGAFFEVIGLRLLHKPPSQQVTPAAGHNPGYDGSVAFNGLRLDLSLKNYGTSAHEGHVTLKAREIEDKFVSILRANQLTGLELRAVAKGYPTDNDWGRLRNNLPELLSQERKPGEMAQDGFWSVVFHPISADFHPLSKNNPSYVVTLLIPQHVNEKQNLISKLSTAYANADKHAVGVGDPNVCRALMIHLPPMADMTACKQWAAEYLSETPNGLVDLVIFYQPAVISGEGQNVIMHSLELVPTPNYSVWLRQGEGRMHPLCFNLPVGVGGPASQTILTNDAGGQLQTTGIWYPYQSGEIWTVYESINGVANMMLSNPAPGVLRHGTVRTEGSGEIELRGIFPPDNRLLIFQ